MATLLHPGSVIDVDAKDVLVLSGQSLWVFGAKEHATDADDFLHGNFLT